MRILAGTTRVHVDLEKRISDVYGYSGFDSLAAILSEWHDFIAYGHEGRW